MVVQQKLAIFWLVFGLCWKVLEKNGVAVRHFGMPEQQTSHWRRQIVRISLALLPIHFWSVVAELSPLHLMDDVLGQAMIFFNLLLIAFWYGRCAAKAGVIKSRTPCDWSPLPCCRLSRLR